MLYFLNLVFLVLLTTVDGSPVMEEANEGVHRIARGIRDWPFFSKHSTEAPITTTTPVKIPNNLNIGLCLEDDKVRRMLDKILF